VSAEAGRWPHRVQFLQQVGQVSWISLEDDVQEASELAGDSEVKSPRAVASPRRF